jgi:hypothetical protein
MQAKFSNQAEAIRLRRQGLSYSEIQKIVSVSKASLSLWLNTIPLTLKQKKRLAQLSLVGQVAGAKAQHEKRLKRLQQLEKEVQNELSKLLPNPFFTLGLALYWAEGSKQKPWHLNQRTSVSNSDPLLILTIRKWFTQYCSISKNDFIYRLYVHITADREKARLEWAKILNINPEVIAVSFKKHKIQAYHPHDHYKGQMVMSVRKSVWLNRRIELWTKADVFMPFFPFAMRVQVFQRISNGSTI